MTGDLGPGEMRADELATVFEPYLMSAAGLAAERQHESAAALLNDYDHVDVALADAPITASQGDARVAVDVVLTVADLPGGPEADAARRGVADQLNEVAAADGYRVRTVRTTPAWRR